MPASGSRTSGWAEYNAKIDEFRRKYGANYDPSMPSRANKEGEAWANILLGGPVGWYKGITGKSILGPGMEPFEGTTLSGYMTEDVFNSMTDDEWASFAHMNDEAQRSFIASKRKQMEKENAQLTEQQRKEKELADKAAAREAQQDDLIKKVQAFAAEMNMPMEQLMQKDGVAQALHKASYQGAFNQGGGAGVGGLSAVNAARTTENALLGYQGQRQAMGQQALGNAFGMLSNQMNQAEDIARYNHSLNLQMQEAEAMRRMQEYQQGLGAAQGKAGMIGGVIGGIWGGPTGAAMGQTIGSNMGGQRYQSSNPFKSYQYSYPSSTRPSGGGLGSKGGGYGNY